MTYAMEKNKAKKRRNVLNARRQYKGKIRW